MGGKERGGRGGVWRGLADNNFRIRLRSGGVVLTGGQGSRFQLTLEQGTRVVLIL